MFHLEFEGSSDILEPTGFHRLYSIDREDWVPTDELHVGERLWTQDGNARISQISRKPSVHRVFNLEVDTDHSYLVSALGVLSHNQNPCVGPPVRRGPDFIASKGGTIVPVPKGASGPVPVETGKGFRFVDGHGGNGLDSKVTEVRIMDPVTSGKYQYPKGYASYENAAGQTVNPYTGKTIPKTDPNWHNPLR